MDSFTYVNIFETKGLEYLLLLSFWLLFIYLVRYLSPSKKKPEEVVKAQVFGKKNLSRGLQE